MTDSEENYIPPKWIVDYAVIKLLSISTGLTEKQIIKILNDVNKKEKINK